MLNLGLGFLMSLPAYAQLYSAADDSAWSVRALGECLFTLTTDNISGSPQGKGA